MSSADTAAIAAGAAVLASALTGLSTFLVGRETIKRNSGDLATRLERNTADLGTQLVHERAAAREDRDQARRLDAYIALLKYVFWLRDVKNIAVIVVNRQQSAIQNLRPDGRLPTTAEAAAAERAMVLEVGPTAQEQKLLDAGPNSEDNAATYALVTAVASDAVLQAFEELMDRDRAVSSGSDAVADALWRGIEPISAEQTIDESTGAFTQIIEAATDLLKATFQFLGAAAKFDEAVENLRKLVRSELNDLGRT